MNKNLSIPNGLQLMKGSRNNRFVGALSKGKSTAHKRQAKEKLPAHFLSKYGSVTLIYENIYKSSNLRKIKSFKAKNNKAIRIPSIRLNTHFAFTSFINHPCFENTQYALALTLIRMERFKDAESALETLFSMGKNHNGSANRVLKKARNTLVQVKKIIRRTRC